MATSTTSSSIIGSSAKSNPLEASQLEDSITPVAENTLLDGSEGELKVPASPASIKQSQAALSTAIKAFVEKISELIATLSKLLESLASSPKEPTAQKKITPETENTKKSTTKKPSGKAKSKLASEAKKIASLAAQSSASTPSSSLDKEIKSSSAVAKTSADSSKSNLLISNPTATSTAVNSSILIDPTKGHGDDNLAVSTNRAGAPQIYTEDGFIINFEAKDQAWNITSPEGKISRIWGDPHVAESDGDRWDFKERSSFLFGNNKVTVETAPLANGQTLSSRVTIYNGDSRVTVSGVDKDTPVFEAIRNDAKIDDALQDDGDIFILGKEANGEDQFILLKDSGEKFSQQFAPQLANSEFKAKYLTTQQIAALK